MILYSARLFMWDNSLKILAFHGINNFLISGDEKDDEKNINRNFNGTICRTFYAGPCY